MSCPSSSSAWIDDLSIDILPDIPLYIESLDDYVFDEGDAELSWPLTVITVSGETTTVTSSASCAEADIVTVCANSFTQADLVDAALANQISRETSSNRAWIDEGDYCSSAGCVIYNVDGGTITVKGIALYTRPEINIIPVPTFVPKQKSAASIDIGTTLSNVFRMRGGTLEAASSCSGNSRQTLSFSGGTWSYSCISCGNGYFELCWDPNTKQYSVNDGSVVFIDVTGGSTTFSPSGGIVNDNSIVYLTRTQAQGALMPSSYGIVDDTTGVPPNAIAVIGKTYAGGELQQTHIGPYFDRGYLIAVGIYECQS